MNFIVEYLNNIQYKRIYLITYENGNIEYIISNGRITIKRIGNERKILKYKILYRCNNILDVYKYFDKRGLK